MKTLTDNLNEALKIGKNLSKFSTYSCQPKTRRELEDIIEERISKEGPNCDLNDIDVSLIDDMSYLFCKSSLSTFNGDISNWNVRNVKEMTAMFRGSKFNGDISKWDVSGCQSMGGMFASSDFNGDISRWDISNAKVMTSMFANSKFTQDLSNWVIDKTCKTMFMFVGCKISKDHMPRFK